MKDSAVDPRTQIPNINALTDAVRRTLANPHIPHEIAVRLARVAAARFRMDPPSHFQESMLAPILEPLLKPGPRRVINATGILLHTNLGRAPLDADIISAALEEVAGYTDLEFDLDSGKRGHRDRHFADLARLVWGVEDAILVNNAAGAVCLTLAALGATGETIVSRGELIEIGGSFRLPEIMKQAGTRLVEVGATNKTKPGDYRTAIGPKTRCLLKAHWSNFRIEGFTQSTDLETLVTIGREAGIPVVMDLGSGLSRHAGYPEIPEPYIEDYLEKQPDVLIFSGDKLFGSVQTGIILGTGAVLRKIRKHPMMRMLRADKLTISILCRQLAKLAQGASTPLVSLANQSQADLRTRASNILKTAGTPQWHIQDDWYYAGGGSLPQERMPSISLVTRVPKPSRLAARFRGREQPIVGYIHDETYHLNLASVFDDQDGVLIEALRESG